MQNYHNVIYVLTNPAFPQYVKIGYAENLEERLRDLNSSPALPLAFRAYGVYEVDVPLLDKKVHKMIDAINSELRAIDQIDGRMRKREFFAMSADDAYALLGALAEYDGREEKLHLITPTNEEEQEERKAEEVIERHERDTRKYIPLIGRTFVLEKEPKNVHAIVEVDDNGKWILKKGSIIAQESTYSCPNGTKNLRSYYLHKGAYDETTFTLYEDIPFNSPSAASCFALYASSDGTFDFVDANTNKNVKEILKELQA